MTARQRAFALALALLLIVLQPFVATAASVRLTADPVPAGVYSFKISPDGEYVVYEVRDFSQPLHKWLLYSVPLVGGPRTLLAAVSQVNLSEAGYFISPDGRRVIFELPYGNSSSQAELWSVPIGGPATAATGLGVADGSAVSIVPLYRATADGAIIVYTSTDTTTGITNLYSVPAVGPLEARRALNPAGDSVSWYLLTPGGEEVIYSAVGDGQRALYRVALARPETRPELLLKETCRLGLIMWPKITADGHYLLFTTVSADHSERNLYSLDLSTPAGVSRGPVRLNEGGNAGERFLLSPAGDRVVYSVEETPGTGSFRSVHPGGPAASSVVISLPRPPWSAAGCLHITPDGTTVVYCTRTYEEPELYPYSVPIDGPAESAVRLGAPIGNEAYFELQLTPDGSRVLYEVDAVDNGTVVHRLYSAPVVGPSSDYQILSGQLNVYGTPYWAVEISPDSRLALYPDMRDPTYRGELYVVPVGGPSSAAARINGDLEPGTGVHDRSGLRAFAPDGVRVVYIAQQLGDQSPQLYVADSGKALVGFGAHEMLVSENSSEVRIPLRLSQPSVLPVTVTVVDETWTGIPGEGRGFDYELLSDKVTFAPGETVAYLTLRPIDDGVPETDPSFLLALTAPENAGLSGMSRIRVRIVDWAGYVPQVGR